MPRERTLNEDSAIPNLFQGAAPVNPPERRGEVYPGDRDIRSDTGITIQIHTLNLLDRVSKEIRFEEVPNIAVWLPTDIAGDVLIQNQGGLDEQADG